MLEMITHLPKPTTIPDGCGQNCCWLCGKQSKIENEKSLGDCCI